MGNADPDELIAAGQVDRAVAALEAAGGRGDASAWLRLATMRLVGDVVPRDVGAARALLARARERGDSDAALMEVALTANGSGGEPDWAGAVALLEQAAQRHEAASEQLALLRAMNLDAAGNPRTLPPIEQLSERPYVAIAHRFLTPAEARHIVLAAADLLEPSTVVDPNTGRLIAHPIRTSRSAAIGPTRETLPIQAVLRRIARLTGTDVRQGEPLTLLDYRAGQEYRPHHDALPGVGNQRVATVLLYLNQGYEGGQTHFLHNGLTVSGRGGDMLLFHNVLPDGRPDPAARHAGLPVSSGQKLLATRWIRARPFDVWKGPEAA